LGLLYRTFWALCTAIWYCPTLSPSSDVSGQQFAIGAGYWLMILWLYHFLWLLSEFKKGYHHLRLFDTFLSILRIFIDIKFKMRKIIILKILV